MEYLRVNLNFQDKAWHQEEETCSIVLINLDPEN